MKKLEKLFEGRTLSAAVGKPNTYGYKQAVVSASESNGQWTFTFKTLGGMGYESTQTIDLQAVLNMMKAFSPKASAWKVSRKAKEVKAAPVKEAPVPVVVAAPVAIKKGRR